MAQLLQGIEDGKAGQSGYQTPDQELLAKLEAEAKSAGNFAQRVTSTELAEVFEQLGFNEREATSLIKLLTDWDKGIKQRAFEERFRDIKVVQARAATGELGTEPPSFSEEVRGLGEAVFWATMCKQFDTSLPDRMATIRASSAAEYKEVERFLETFLKNCLFASDHPALKILKEEHCNTGKPIQTTFLKGLIAPFVECYDEAFHDTIFDKIKDWFRNIDYKPAVGFADLGLSLNEERVLRDLATGHTPAQVVVSHEPVQKNRQIGIIIDTYQGQTKQLEYMNALLGELQGSVQIDESTLVSVLRALDCKAEGLSPDQTIMGDVMNAMRTRGIGDWGMSATEPFQNFLALKALMSVDQISAASAAEVAKLAEIALVAGETEKSEGYKVEFKSDCRNLMAALLIEKTVSAES